MADEAPAQEAQRYFVKAYEAQMNGDLDAAITLYQKSIAAVPTAEAHTFLGWVYSFEGRYSEAIDECLKAITVDASFGNPYNDIGSYLIAQGDHWACVRWFRRALLAPRYESYAFPHFNLGRVQLEKGQLQEAKRSFERALSYDPNYLPARQGLAFIRSQGEEL